MALLAAVRHSHVEGFLLLGDWNTELEAFSASWLQYAGAAIIPHRGKAVGGATCRTTAELRVLDYVLANAATVPASTDLRPGPRSPWTPHVGLAFTAQGSAESAV